MGLRVELSPDAREKMHRLPAVIRLRVGQVLRRLTAWPNVSGVKPLTGPLAGWFRIRTGDYRIRFYVAGEVVIVDRVMHRRDVYRE